MSEIKCVLFDIGGVLVDWHMSWITREVSKQFHIDESLVIDGFTKYLHELDTGKIDEQLFWKKIAVGSESESLANNTESLWKKYFTKNAKPNENVIKLSQTLKEQYVMGIISNIEKITHRVVADWNVLEPFEHKFMSYQIGYSKPHPKIYDHVIDNLEFQPNQIIFIDDKKLNVESAQKHEINAIHFTDYQKLLTSLEELGVNV